jgi:hypothetical protein
MTVRAYRAAYPDARAHPKSAPVNEVVTGALSERSTSYPVNAERGIAIEAGKIPTPQYRDRGLVLAGARSLARAWGRARACVHAWGFECNRLISTVAPLPAAPRPGLTDFSATCGG